jgi:flagellar hook assembly protein FlgD
VMAIYSNNQWLAESFGSVKDHGYTTTVSIAEGESQVPIEFSLSQNYPNPFNPTTLISFGLPQDSEVKVEVFNLLGQRVKTLLRSQEKAGYKTIIWDGKDESGKGVASGVYFYRVEAGKYNETKKMTLLR